MTEKKHLLGNLPPWGEDELPAPLPFTFKNLLKTIGPGAILLAACIGGGEWVVGPVAAVKNGSTILWIATIAIVFQTLFNLEAIRYTLYTGEPILVGVMRLFPGSRFWSSFWVLVSFLQLGVPALAKFCAGILFAAFAGRLAGVDDGDWVNYLSYVVIIATVGVLISGRTIERMLEWVSWFMIAFIFSFLLVANLFFVPFEHWIETFLGFFSFGVIEGDVDLVLLGTLAATAGSGGIGNFAVSNWVRDKGFGMGATVGAITSAFSSNTVQHSGVGKVFRVNEESLERWRLWWKYVSIDQIVLFGVGAFVGMFLNVNLATSIIPAGEELSGAAAGAFQAKYMAEQLWEGFWFLAILNGFWILFSTQVGNTDILIRTVTDILWVASPSLRERRRMRISKLYYALLGIFTVWALIVVNFGNALDQFKYLGSLGLFILFIGAIQILFVNLKLLPRELRPRMWRRVALGLCALFYAIMGYAVLTKVF